MVNAYEVYEPPSYPEHRLLTEAEIEAKQRATSVIRAQSPGVRVCSIDAFALEHGDEQDPRSHLHSYDALMEWRHSHIDPQTGAIVEDGDSWSYWMTYSAWAQIAPPLPPPEPFPIPPVGWHARVRVVPEGISQMNGVTDSWLGFTIVTKTPAVTLSAYAMGGNATRVRLSGSYQTLEAYISPCKSGYAVNSLTDLYRLTVGGNTTFTVGNETITDELPFGVDGSNGFLLTLYISAAPGLVKFREPELGWSARYKQPGNFTRELNKGGTDWLAASQDSLSLLMVEGYYPPI
jgi:hypothetical protein